MKFELPLTLVRVKDDNITTIFFAEFPEYVQMCTDDEVWDEKCIAHTLQYNLEKMKEATIKNLDVWETQYTFKTLTLKPE